MSSLPERYTRTRYASPGAAMRDALELHRELLTALADQDSLFIDRSRVEFLARRVAQLIEAAADEADRRDA